MTNKTKLETLKIMILEKMADVEQLAGQPMCYFDTDLDDLVQHAFEIESLHMMTKINSKLAIYITQLDKVV